jgi:hypothetical protein
MLNILKNTINRVFASGVDSDASAFITATGLSGTTQKSAITTLVKDLKSSGLWSKMKAVYPMVTDNYNLLSYTEDFSNTYWLKTNATITTNSINSPNGTLTADTITDNTTSGFHYIANGPLSLGQNGNNTCSIYAKANTLSWISLYVFDGATAYFTYFNLSNGTIGTNPSGTTATIVDAGNGWYRCSITRNYNATAANANCGYMTANADGVNSYAGTGKSIYVWGAQFEIGASLSTYQPILTTPSAFMASQMKYNLKDARDLDAAFRLTWSGGWTYSATGATPNGTNAFADTKLTPSVSLGQNLIHISAYSRTDIAQGSVLIGSYDGTVETSIYPRSATNTLFTALNSNTSASAGASTSSLGNFTASRINSTQEFTYPNNSKLTRSQSSLNNLTRTLFIGALNYLGSPGAYTSRQLAFSTIGDGLTDQEAFLLNQIVEKYQVALSRGVQAAQSFYYNSAYSNEANTYLYSTQITGTTQVSAINTLINGLKANNLWTKMKAVYPFVTDKTLQADMAAQMKFNLVNPQDSDAAFRLAFSGGWTYSTNGAQPNGTNGYADTKLVPSANLSANNIHLSYYSRTDSAVASSSTMGADSATDNLRLIIRRTSNIAFTIIGSATKGLSQFLVTDSRGLFVANAPNSTTRELYKNSTSLTPTSQSGLGLNGTPNANLYLSAYNNNGVVFEYDNKQCAFSSIGDGLSSAEIALLNQLITDFQTTLSRNV